MKYSEFFHPGNLEPETFDYLLALGWYPMGRAIFTISHLERQWENLENPVHWIRYELASLSERPSHRRIRRRNAHLELEIIEPYVHSDELDELYARYYQSISFDGYPDIENATFPRGTKSPFQTHALVIRDQGRAVSCGIFYTGKNSAASILHFYDPAYRALSPGKYLILRTIDYCRSAGIKWYYPGYIIEGDARMDYKLFLGAGLARRYHPLNGPLGGEWVPLHG